MRTFNSLLLLISTYASQTTLTVSEAGGKIVLRGRSGDRSRTISSSPNDRFPSLSESEKFVVFVRDVDNDPFTRHIIIVNVKSSAEQVVDVPLANSQWSEFLAFPQLLDNQGKVLFVSQRDNRQGDLLQYDLRSRRLRRLLSASSIYRSYCGDGHIKFLVILPEQSLRADQPPRRSSDFRLIDSAGRILNTGNRSLPDLRAQYCF